MKTRDELLKLLELRELRQFAIVANRRRLCARCGRLTWDGRFCRACRTVMRRLARAIV